MLRNDVLRNVFCVFIQLLTLTSNARKLHYHIKLNHAEQGVIEESIFQLG